MVERYAKYPKNPWKTEKIEIFLKKSAEKFW